MAAGDPAVAALTVALRGERPEVRRQAAVALVRLAPGCWAAVDALAVATGDDDGGVAVHAAVAIIKIFEANAGVRLSCRQRRERSPGGYVAENEKALAVLTGLVGRK